MKYLTSLSCIYKYRNTIPFPSATATPSAKGSYKMRSPIQASGAN